MGGIELYTKQVAEFIQNRKKYIIRAGDAGRRERLFLSNFVIYSSCYLFKWFFIEINERQKGKRLRHIATYLTEQFN